MIEGEHLKHVLTVAEPIEWRQEAPYLVKDHAEGVDVGLLVVRVAGVHLGGHVP